MPSSSLLPVEPHSAESTGRLRELPAMCDARPECQVSAGIDYNGARQALEVAQNDQNSAVRDLTRLKLELNSQQAVVQAAELKLVGHAEDIQSQTAAKAAFGRQGIQSFVVEGLLSELQVCYDSLPAAAAAAEAMNCFMAPDRCSACLTTPIWLQPTASPSQHRVCGRGRSVKCESMIIDVLNAGCLQPLPGAAEQWLDTASEALQGSSLQEAHSTSPNGESGQDHKHP